MVEGGEGLAVGLAEGLAVGGGESCPHTQQVFGQTSFTSVR